MIKEIAKVVNNNCDGWTNVIETEPNVTLDIGTKLYTDSEDFAKKFGCQCLDFQVGMMCQHSVISTPSNDLFFKMINFIKRS